MEFFQTVMGKRFFEGQLPKLINALEKLGTELERYNDNLEKELKGDDELTERLLEFDLQSLKTEVLESVPEIRKHVILEDLEWTEREITRLDFSSGDKTVVLRLYDDYSTNLKYGANEWFGYAAVDNNLPFDPGDELKRNMAINEAKAFMGKNYIDHLPSPKRIQFNPNK